MKSRILIWIISILVVGAGLVVLLTNPWSTTATGIEKILPSDPLSSDKVLICSGVDTLLFEKQDSVWIMDGSEEVSKEQVENILFASQRMQLKSIGSVDELSSCDYFVDVILFKKNRVMGSYGFASWKYGNYIFGEKRESVFGVEIPGYESLLLNKVFSDNPDHYRLHLLIDLLPSEITSIEVHPISGKAFSVTQDASFNIITTDIISGRDISKEVDERKIRLLFSYFNAIRYNEVVIDSAHISEDQMALVKVIDNHGIEREMRIFALNSGAEDEVDMFKAAVVFNGRGNALTVDYYYLDLLMRGLERYK